MLFVRSLMYVLFGLRESNAATATRQRLDGGIGKAPTSNAGDPRRIALRLLLGLSLCVGLSGTAHAQVQHIYDENGRLAGTIDPTGNAARFT
jgi:hypothetical protein